MGALLLLPALGLAFSPATHGRVLASSPAVAPPPRAPACAMLDLGDAVFVSGSAALLAATYQLITSNRAFDSGVGRGLEFRLRNEDEGESILSKIRDARSTSAPGFVFEVVEEPASEASEAEPEAPSMADAIARAQEAEATRAARDELQARLDAAVASEDYAAAAALKKELDDLGLR